MGTITSHPDRRSILLVDAPLDATEHALEVPKDKFPANVNRYLLALDDRTRLEAGEVLQVGRVEQRVREIFADEKTRY